MNDGVLRAIDANLNRLREGIRVVEELCRFSLDLPAMASALKKLRHEARSKLLLQALTHRDTDTDPLKKTMHCETIREDVESILIANLKRTQESARTLEELLKLYDMTESECFKRIRYELYSVEKSLLLPQNNNASNSKTAG